MGKKPRVTEARGTKASTTKIQKTRGADLAEIGMAKKPRKAAPKIMAPASEPEPRSEKKVFDSLAAAASELDVPIQVLKKLKREGAPGFRGSRVYAEELLPYLRAREDMARRQGLPEDRESLECRKMRAQCERIEFNNHLAQSKYVHREILADHLGKFAGETVSILRQKLENEFPAASQGRTIPQIREKAKAVVDEILARFRAHFDGWTI